MGAPIHESMLDYLNDAEIGAVLSRFPSCRRWFGRQMARHRKRHDRGLIAGQRRLPLLPGYGVDPVLNNH